MKKKILILLVTIISLGSLCTVYAADNCGPASPRLTKIAVNNNYETEINIYYKKDGEVQSTEHAVMRIQKLNGNWALCLHLGWASNSSLSFYPTKFYDNTLTTAQKNHYRKAYQLLTENKVGDANLTYVVAQVAVWISSLSSGGLVPTDMFKKTVTSAYCSMFTHYYAKIGCGEDDEGYKYTDSLYGKTITEAIHQYTIADFYNGNKLAIYYSTDVAYAQPLLSKYVCNPTCDETDSCATDEITDPDRHPDGSCDYSYDTSSIPTNCLSGVSSGHISDVNSWECIFNSTRESSPINTRYLEDNSNSYCNIYCREQAIATLPSNVVSVNQGKYITLGSSLGTGANISPIIYDGVKNCRPTSAAAGTINVEQFKRDLNNAESQVYSLWNQSQTSYGNYLAAVEAKNHCSVINSQYKCKRPEYTSDSDINKCNNDAESASQSTYDSAKSSCLAGFEKGKKGYTAAQISQCEQEATDAKNQKKQELANSCIESNKRCYDGWYQQYRCTGSGSNGEYGGFSTSYTYEENENSPDSKISGYYADYSYKRRLYEDSIIHRNNIIQSINSCTQMASGVKFDDFNPSLTINYDEPLYGNMGTTGWNLKGSLAENKEITYYKGGDALNGTSTLSTTNISDSNLRTSINVAKCGTNGSHCTTESRQYYVTTWWELFYNKQYNYQLQDGIYRYVEKGSGQSVHTMSSSDIEYIDVGFSNLPIHYSTKPGNYEYVITTTSFGSGSRFNSDVPSPNIYTCEYNVSCNNTIQNNDLNEYHATCPGATTNVTGTGLNVIYRPISLYSKQYAFPGLAGTGRTPGANWNDDTLINNYIVNNRGVTDYEVYHLDPLYEIELTPALMKVFRNYNKEQNSKTITMYGGTFATKFGIAGYSDFSNMNCDSNGSHCVSSLLRGNVTGYNAIKVTGCAIASSGAYTNCGRNNQAW